MKNSEWMFLICGFVGMVGFFLKIPFFLYWSNSSSTISGRINKAGTIVLIAILPIVLSFALGYKMIFEDNAEMATRPESFRWLATILISGGFSLMFFMFVGLFRSGIQFFKAVGEMITAIAKVTLALMPSGPVSKTSDKKSSPYNIGYDLGKGYADGVSHGISGDEWKFPDKKDKEDKKKKPGEESGPDLGRGRWN